LQKWQDKHTELKQAVEDMDAEQETIAIDLSDAALLPVLSYDIFELNDEHSDFTISACLLCERQFKSLDDLKKHQVKSELHKV
jgi:RNA-binding protein 5/10